MPILMSARDTKTLETSMHNIQRGKRGKRNSKTHFRERGRKTKRHHHGTIGGRKIGRDDNNRGRWGIGRFFFYPVSPGKTGEKRKKGEKDKERQRKEKKDKERTRKTKKDKERRR